MRNKIQDSDDEELDHEEEKIMRELREKRLGDMKSEASETQDNMTKGHGQYTEIVESEFLKYVTGSAYVVCHFYHKDFERCKIMDMHLRKIAQQHTETKFIYIDSERTPFFITKLQIQTLPTIVYFMDGIAVDRLCGFEEMGNRDDFQTIALTRRMVASGVIKALTKEEQGPTFKRAGRGRDDSEGDDSDEFA